MNSVLQSASVPERAGQPPRRSPFARFYQRRKSLPTAYFHHTDSAGGPDLVRALLESLSRTLLAIATSMTG